MAKILSETELKIQAGWGSDSKMASVYVHLDEQDVANKLLKKYGIAIDDENKEETIEQIPICPNIVCSYQSNPSGADFCLKCGKPISDFLKKNGFTQELKKYSKLLAKI